VHVQLSIGKYKDKVLCDIIFMEACHILLGRAWKFDRKIIQNGISNTITFLYKEKKLCTSSFVTISSGWGSSTNENQKGWRGNARKYKREKTCSKATTKLLLMVALISLYLFLYHPHKW